MLDWDKIDGDALFQRLVNHLFALECNSPNFIPSSPYIGADGGWDGRYEGYYAYEGKKGIWSIQAKWTTKSLKEAVSALKPRIRTELRKAEGRDVDHLRIATNAELKVEQVVELQELNGGEVDTLRIWPREELSRRIELQPYLRYLFFGLPQYPKFVPWDVYFREMEKHLLPDSASKISKFQGHLETARRFILSEDTDILLIHSPGGYGKSHLLREIAQATHQVDSERQVWMARLGHRKMEDATDDELVAGRRYLLVADDADRFLDEVRPLLSLCKFRRSFVKVILALRTSGLRFVHDTIVKSKCDELYAEMQISHWSKEELVQLLRMAAGQDMVEDEEMIAAIYPNPFLVVWIARQMRKEPVLDFAKIKEKFVNDVTYEAEQCLRDVLGSSQARDFVTNLACVVPFSTEDSVLQILSGQFGLDLSTTREAVQSLEKAGILRTVGKSLRFNPDMKGDLYLAYVLEKTTASEKLRGLMQTWLPVCAERLLMNVEAAVRYADSPPVKAVLSEMVAPWIESAETTSDGMRRERLNLIEKVACVIPERCLDLLNAYLADSVSVLSDSPSSKDIGDGVRVLTTDDYGPVITELMKVPAVRNEVVETIARIENKDMRGTYGNYKPSSLIRDAVSPLSNNHDLILTTLDVLSNWLSEPTDSRINLISAAVSEVLAGSHEYTRATIGGVSIGEKALRDIPEVRAIRDKALGILRKMITHPLQKVKLAAIQTAGNIGETRTGRISEGDLPLSNRIAEERQEIVEEIGKLVSAKTDFEVLNVIENLFLNWWAQETAGTDGVREYLGEFPRNPEYLVFRYFVSPDRVAEDFHLLEKQAPATDKWSWFVRTVGDKEMLKPEDFTELVGSLNEKYSEEDQIVGFLVETDDRMASCDPWAHPPIVTRWVEQNPKAFLSIREQSKLWNEVPQRFRREIDLAIGDRSEEFINKLAEEVLSKLPDVSVLEVDTLLTSLRRHSLEQQVLYSWISELLERGNRKTRVLIIPHIYYIFEKVKELDPVVRLLRVAVSNEAELTSEFVRSLSFAIHSLSTQLDSVDPTLVDGLRKELIDKLKEIPKIDWHVDRLLEFCFDGIDSAIAFVEYRLQKSREMRQRGMTIREYEAIPFQGINAIARQIHTFDDYEELVGKVVGWYEEDVFWRGFYLRYLMRPIRASANDAGKLYIEMYVLKQLEMGSFGNARIASKFLSLNENSISLFIQVAEKGMASGESKAVEELLHDRMFPGGVWSSNLGEPPPALLARRALYEKMYGRTEPGKLRTLVKRCIDSISREIEEDIKSDEEFLAPRG